MDEKINNSINKLLNEIKGPIEQINKLQRQRIVEINIEIDNIIKSNILDDKKIEKIIDELLDLAYWDYKEALILFKKIISYYKKINPNNAKEYKKYFKEIRDEDY